MNVALFNSATQTYDVSDFRSTMVDPECGGFTSQIDAPMLTTPHSVSMVDFDGDCMADLFMTVQDESKSKVYYEIYVRREQHQKRDTLEKPRTNGHNSFCLAQYDDISKI